VSRVFIALATRKPPLALFDRQLASLSAQRFRDWSGAVVDDGSAEELQRDIAERVAREPRLHFIANRDRVGFYANFGRALFLAPAGCEFVALCDQDDTWSPDKLAHQVEALEVHPNAQLCYTDLRLVGTDGAILAPSFWSMRPHRCSFRELIYNNVVTGATTLIRRRLLDVALPLPPNPGGAFHDHWLALCAMATGGLEYLDEPLVDYTQRPGNVIGAQSLEHTGRGATARLLGNALRQIFVDPRHALESFDDLASHAVRADARLRSFADALRDRTASLPPGAETALRPFLHRHRGVRALDLVGPTLLGTVAAREETNLEPLKIPLGIFWAVLRGRR